MTIHSHLEQNKPMRIGIVLIIAGALFFVANTPSLFRDLRGTKINLQSVAEQLQPKDNRQESITPRENTASTETLNLDTIKTLILETSDGIINVDTKSSNVRNQLQIVKRGAVSTNVTRDGNTLRVELKSQLLNCQKCGADYTVALREGINLELHNSSGNIFVQGNALDIKASAADGNINLTNTGNTSQIKLEVASGNINLQNAQGKIDISNADGNTELRNLENAQLNLEASSGTVFLDGIGFSNNEQSLTLADTKLELRNARNANLKISSSSQKILLENIEFSGLSNIESANSEVRLLNTKNTHINISNSSQNIILENTTFMAGSSNKISIADGNVSIVNLNTQDGFKLEGTGADTSFQNALTNFQTELNPNEELLYRSVRNGENPAKLEIDSSSARVTIQ